MQLWDFSHNFFSIYRLKFLPRCHQVNGRKSLISNWSSFQILFVTTLGRSKKLNNSQILISNSEPAPTNILDLRPVAPAFVHHKARATLYPQCAEKRFPVPDDKVPWEVSDNFSRTCSQCCRLFCRSRVFRLHRLRLYPRFSADTCFCLEFRCFCRLLSPCQNHVFCFKVEFPDYNPVSYTAPVVLKKPPWADPDLMSM